MYPPLVLEKFSGLPQDAENFETNFLLALATRSTVHMHGLIGAFISAAAYGKMAGVTGPFVPLTALPLPPALAENASPEAVLSWQLLAAAYTTSQEKVTREQMDIAHCKMAFYNALDDTHL